MASRPPLQGYNHNIRYGSRVYHVQTEDSGLEHPHLFTHLYFRGMIIASAREDYSELAAQAGHEPAVRKLMQAQHKRLMKQLRNGEFDDKIAAMIGPEEDEKAASPPEETAAPAAPAPPSPQAQPPTPPAPVASPQPASEAVPPALAPEPIAAEPLPAIAADAASSSAGAPAAPPSAAAHIPEATQQDAPKPPIASAGWESGTGEPSGIEGALAQAAPAPSARDSEPTMVQPHQALRPDDEVAPSKAPAPPAARTPPPTPTPPPLPTLRRSSPSGLFHQAKAPAPPSAPEAAKPSVDKPGVYQVPSWTRTRNPAVQPAAEAPRPRTPGASPPPVRLGSTPQRYTAPSARGAPRARRVTGSYASANTEVPRQPTAPRAPRKTSGIYQITLQGAKRAGAEGKRAAVVARPAVIIDRPDESQQQPPGRQVIDGLSAPGSGTSHRVPTGAQRAVQGSGANPPPPPPPRAQQANAPNIFGADLISERSLDEVILQYLSEDKKQPKE